MCLVFAAESLLLSGGGGGMNTCLSASPASLEMALSTCFQISLVVATRRKRVAKIEEMWEPLPFSRGFQMALLHFITMHRVRGLELKANHKLKAWWDICHPGCFKDGVKRCLKRVFFFYKGLYFQQKYLPATYSQKEEDKTWKEI